MAAAKKPAKKAAAKRPKTGGRKKGSLNKKTVEQRQRTEEIVARVFKEGMTPLDILLEAMKEAYQQGGALMAAPWAKDAAPYVHPKLANIDANVQGDFIVEVRRFAPDEPESGTTEDTD